MTAEPKTIGDVPTIEWNGKKWPVPELAPRELDKVWEPIISLSELLLVDGGENLSTHAFSMTRDQARQMRDVVLVGLQRAHPEIDRETFEDVPITTPELLSAFFVVRAQSLIYGRVSQIKRDAKPGEAEAGAQTSST